MFLLIVFFTLNAESSSFVDKIPQILSQHIGTHMGIRLYRGHSEPCVIKFENDSNLGILYVDYSSDKHVYNYVRYDTLGNMIMDLRSIKSTPPITGSVDIEDLELTVPCADYIVDKKENLWLFYIDAIDDVYHRYIAWLKMDKNGKVIEDNRPRQWITGQFYALPSQKNKWYLLLEARKFFGVDTLGDRIVHYNMKSPKKISLGASIELKNGNLLIINGVSKSHINYCIINDKGKIQYKSKNAISLENCASYKIQKAGIVTDIDIFDYGDTILVARAVYGSADPEEVRTDVFYLIRFDENGKLIYPKEGIQEGKILPIDERPANTSLAIVCTAYRNLDGLWIYGCDSKGNLYLKHWSHRVLKQYEN